MPAVERLVAASRTQVESAFTRYMAAHDTVVVSAMPLSPPSPCSSSLRLLLSSSLSPLSTLDGQLAAAAPVRWGLVHDTPSGALRAAPRPPARPRALMQADPRYGAAVAKGGELLASLQGSAAYRAASSRLAPLLQPYAETATKLASPYVQVSRVAAGQLTPRRRSCVLLPPPARLPSPSHTCCRRARRPPAQAVASHLAPVPVA